MDIKNPIFVIPTQQVKSSGKSGGGKYTYYGDKNKFEAHKRSRVNELDGVLQSTRLESNIQAPNERLFFELEFDPAATSKSAQPKKLLKTYFIDIEAQVTKTKFLGTATEENLNSFRDTVSKLDVKKNKYEAAYLSAIKKIESIKVKSKIDTKKLAEKEVGFVYLHSILSAEEGKSIFEQVKKHANHSTALEYFVAPSGSKVIYGTFSRDDLGELVDESPKNPFLKFEKSEFFTVPQSSQSDYVVDVTEVIHPESDAKVAVLDTGIKPLPILKDLIIESKDYVSGRNDSEVGHGTMVGSRVIFGNNIEDVLDDENRFYAQVKVLDFRVLHQDEKTETSDKEIVDSVVKILEKHSKDVKVYNLSFAKTLGVHMTGRTYLGEQLDSLARSYGIIFVVAAGNHKTYLKQNQDLDYPDCILAEDATISTPADGVNVIAVGSISDSDSSRSLAKNNEPSPFTRHGEEGMWKPDLVHYGGNVDKRDSSSGIGVKGLSVESGHLAEADGTSLATPLVSQVAARIYDYLVQTGMWSKTSVELTKALLLHSAAYNLPADSTIDKDSLRQLIGFGVPDFGRAVDSSKNSATFIVANTIGLTEKKVVKSKDKDYKAAIQKIQFTVPSELTGKGKKVRLKGTLVYTPQTNANGGVDYVETDIEVNLHYRNSRGTLVSGALTTEKASDYRNKWNPIKSFEKTYNAFDGGMWEIWLIATNRGGADASNLSQDFALVVSVEDVSDDFENRIDLHSVIANQHKQYIQLQPQVKVTVQP